MNIEATEPYAFMVEYSIRTRSKWNVSRGQAWLSCLPPEPFMTKEEYVLALAAQVKRTSGMDITFEDLHAVLLLLGAENKVHYDENNLKLVKEWADETKEAPNLTLVKSDDDTVH